MREMKTVLCVDDDPDDRYLFKSALEKVAPELHFVEAPNGLDALQFLQSAKETAGLPCLVVLDINMPLLNGRQTLERMWGDQAFKDIPVVVFTSSDSPRDKEYFGSRGIELFVKPFDYRLLEPTIRNFIRVCQ